MKVLTVLGTRPEIIKLSRVIAELDARLDHVVAHTGQNHDYELNEIFFQQLDLRKPDHFLQAAADRPAQTVANVIARSDELIEQVQPDALLVLGDTNSCLAAYAAKRRQVPIFHMEAGNRSFDQRVPEEINRKIIDHISDINLVYTEHARRYLLAEGIRGETIIKTGSPMKEVLAHYKPGIDASDVLDRLGLQAGRYFVVSAHREENVDRPRRLAALLDCLNALAGAHDVPLIVSTHPRTRRRLGESAAAQVDPRVRFLKPLGFFDYVRLQQHALCVISDSGTITEESSLLGFPAVTIRQAHERPEGMDEATVLMADLHPQRVEDAVKLAIEHAGGRVDIRPVQDYQPANVSAKVVRIIVSYVDYVNRTVWRKDI